MAPRVGLLLLLLSTVPAAAIDVQLRPAWSGWYRPGLPTEISVTISGLQAAGHFSLSIEGSALTQVQALDLAPGHPQVEHIAVRPVLGHVLRVRLLDEQGESVAVAESWPRPLPGESLIVDTCESGVLSQDGQRHIDIPEERMPTLYQGYAPVRGLILHWQALRRLGPRQRQALTDYLADCGAMVAVAMPVAIAERLADAAGCGGQFLMTTESVTVAQALDQVLLYSAQQLPAPETMARSFPDSADEDGRRSVLGFLALYLTGLVVIAWVSRRSLPLLAYSLAAAGLAVLIWSDRAPSLHLYSWTEMDSDQSVARFSATLRIHGNGPARVDQALPLGMSLLPQSGNASGLALWIDERGRMRVHYQTQLLSDNDLGWRGIIAQAPPLIVQRGTAGQAVLKNPGTRASAPGFLYWQGAFHTLPVLQPGENRPVAPSDELQPSLPRKLLRAVRATASRQDVLGVIVLRQVPTALAGLAPHADGWLLIGLRRI